MNVLLSSFLTSPFMLNLGLNMLFFLHGVNFLFWFAVSVRVAANAFVTSLPSVGWVGAFLHAVVPVLGGVLALFMGSSFLLFLVWEP